MAVWHHSVEGPPAAADYMDIESIYELIDKGFRLGLHGHQHRSEVTNRFIQAVQQDPMAVISAGSLCASPSELPHSFNRQYNVLELTDQCDGVRVHVREMAVGTVFAPSYRPMFGGRSYVDVAIHARPNAGDSAAAREAARILSAEKHVEDGDFPAALELLSTLDGERFAYARTLAIRAAEGLGDPGVISSTIGTPQSGSELGKVVNALLAQGAFEAAQDVVDNEAEALGIPIGMVEELKVLIRVKQALYD
jgi:hypothetical protein